MKGIPGLVIAATLAVAGGICNWLYIARQAEQYERVALVKVDVEQIRRGERFRESDFAKVEIPKRNLGNLDTVAVRWTDLKTVVDQVAAADFIRDQILLQQDLTTPAREDLNDKIGPNERVMFLPVDPRSFNPLLVNPGDEVSFRIPRDLGTAPTAVDPTVPPDVLPSEEIIGPFRILALGNRKGRVDVARAYGQRSGAENVIAVSFLMQGNQPEARAQRLLDILAENGFKGVQVLLHPAHMDQQ